MNRLLYNSFKIIVKVGLFFYNKKTKVSGVENIPKKGAILFVGNHPNGLMDPLIIASSFSRNTHFLVRAAVFKHPIVAKFFNWLGMLPIYRIRDGIQELSKNNEIFNKCEKILRKGKAILIFPEGSHLRKRTIRPLSKGFTRIVFGIIEKYPEVKIHIIPVGITYQNPSKYPSKVAVNFGNPILANDYYNSNHINQSANSIKEKVTSQLKELTVHINDDENYTEIEQQLIKANVDFTEVKKVNQMIASGNISHKEQSTQKELKFIKILIIANSLIPYFLWKKASRKVSEIEFEDTFRFSLNIVFFGLFYYFQTWLVAYLFDWKVGTLYFLSSLLLVFIYTKLSPTTAG
ncbi:lysophospholipid acyltransferase family protein [Tenacibaculum sp. IB213877]|uniref:lysophospholipid acyltransferase family protein n=1 Tax=Tenacibaculum sp. IB213877 TaxID=3097351 RepID=UPI002A5999A8|nr:lysophospholipid acyltransferase family protein [Tenacibaculum sp. IB213877]MDY0781154.1 lysophospholipid acyltransferase family protein [Tenacibaculum sp. IB213877]